MNAESLLQAALAAREHAVAPFSHYKVGAALECRNGKIYGGCNVENSTYGLTVCAERVALWKALSEGEREFVRVAVASQGSQPAPPCGACRQLLWEFGGNLEVILGNTEGYREVHHLAGLLPHPFDRGMLNK